MSFQIHVTGLTDAFKSALGADLSVQDQTEAGQLIGVLASYFTRLEDVMAFLEAGLSVHTATGDQLLAIGSLTGITPLGSERSTVTLTLSGVANTVIPANSRVQTAAGVVFRLKSEATIGSSGNVAADAESVELGAIEADIASISEIVDPVAGWTGVTNAAAAALGRNPETSVEYRARFARAIRNNSIGYIKSIESNIEMLTGVRYVKVFENFTDADVTDRGLTIPAHSIATIVVGGDDDEIFESLRKTKPIGVGMAGTTTASDGIKFYRPTNIPITATIPITVNLDFPADGEQQVIDAFINYISTLGIGSPIDAIQMSASILSIPGQAPTALVTVAKKTGSGDVTTESGLGKIDLITLAESDVTITITLAP